MLRPDTFCGVRVTAGAHLQESLVTRVEDNKLIIEDLARCKWLRRQDYTPEVEIFFPSLQSIYYCGSGSVSCADTIYAPTFSFIAREANGSVSLLVECDSLRALLFTGFSDLTLAGRAWKAQYYTAQATRINALNLEAAYAYINSSSIADDYVKFIHYMYAAIEGSGNIFYSGPDIYMDTFISGSGGVYHY